MQRPDDPTREAAEAVEGRLARQIAAALQAVSDQTSQRQVAEAIRNGNLDMVLYRLPLDRLSVDMRLAFETLANLSAGQAARVSAEVADEMHIRTWFDRLQTDFTGSMQAYRESLVTGVTRDVREAAEAVIRQGIQDGRNPNDIAHDVKQVVPLTGRFSTAVLNYRRALEENTGGALTRELRDKRSDGPVQRAVASGNPLSQAQIDRLVDAYAKKMLAYRSRMISRTESLRAANWGTRASFLQAVQRGDYPLEAVNRKWLVAFDERTCAICISIPRMNPKGVGLTEAFQSVAGPVDLPPQHPHCRCTVLYKVDAMMVRTGQGLYGQAA